MTTIANQLQALANHMDAITDEALSITTHNNLCDLAKAPLRATASTIDRLHLQQIRGHIMTDAQYFRKIALRPTLAAICQQIFNAGFDVRNQFAARRVLSERDMGYWQEFIACALPSDWLIWARECVSHHMKIEMMEYYHDALNALRKI